MNAYWAVVSARFRLLLQYRAAALAGFGTQLFWGLIRVMIFDAFYRSSTAVQPMSFPEVVSYVWLSQAMIRLLPWAGDQEVAGLIRTGNVTYELLRPLDLYGLWFGRSLANQTAPVLLRAVPMFVVAGLFLGLQPPASWSAAGAWLVATASAAVLAGAFSCVLTISLFWTISGQGINSVAAACVWFLSGMIIPLPLFPDWSQPILDFLPFRGLLDTPFRLYLGHMPISEALPALLHQIGWTIALILFGRWLLACGTRRLVVQGG